MIRVLLLAEGQTEETFVNEVLGPHLEARGIWLTPVVVATKRVRVGGKFRGGVSSWRQIEGEIRRLLRDSAAAAVTTLLDYYGLPGDVPGMSDRPPVGPRARVEHVESRMGEVVADRRFRPHVVLHEYEAWIFSDLTACRWVFDDDPGACSCLDAVAFAVGTPEDIDDGPATAPSKHLQRCFEAYDKVLHGPLAVGAIGLDRVRARCPHFASWLGWLESLGPL